MNTPLGMASCKHTVNSEGHNENEIKAAILPGLPVDLLCNSGNIVLNKLKNLWKRFAFKAKISHIGFYMKSGTIVNRLPTILPENCRAVCYRDGEG